MRFTKAHAYGNDFLYVRQADAADAAPDVLARDMCDRHTGIGADGLVFYQAGDGAAAAASMRLFNADGSRAEVSGNGVRALAALLLRDTPGSGGDVSITTEAGTKHLTRIERTGHVAVFRADMGEPRGLGAVTLAAAGETVNAVVLSMGNPQCVLLGPLPDAARFAALGAALERHPHFPDRTNVEFTHVEAPGRVRILIWERGCGPTSSSGTGSCAAAVAAAAYGGADRLLDVAAPGGTQRVEWAPDGRVYLTGSAEIVCDGEWLRQIPRTA